MGTRGRLVAFSGPGDVMSSREVDVPGAFATSWLRKTWDEVHGDRHCRYGALEIGSESLAIYLPEQSLPDTAVCIGARPADGRWLTATVHLGPHRAYVSPEVFLRQMDLGGDHLWLAVGVLRTAGHLEPRGRHFEDGSALFEWGLFGARYYYVERLGRWALYGGGNTPPAKLEQVPRDAPTAQDWLWSVGAVKLGPSNDLT